MTKVGKFDTTSSVLDSRDFGEGNDMVIPKWW
jgi:hypothetical protein